MIQYKASRERIAICFKKDERLDNTSSTFYDGLQCNVLILEDNSTKVCLIDFGCVSLDYYTGNAIKTKIQQATGIPESNIIIWNAHIHPSAKTLNFKESETNDQFIEILSGKLAEGVKKAYGNLEEVHLKTGKINITDLNLNAPYNAKLSSESTPENENSAENELITLSLWDNRNKLFALLVNCTISPANQIAYKGILSKGINDYLFKYIKYNFGNQPVILFGNGPWGNFNHLDDPDPGQPDDFENAEEISNRLGSYIIDTIRNSSPLDGKIKFASFISKFPQRVITPHNEFETILQGMAINNFALVTFPGAFNIESGLEVKKFSPYDNTMVIGMANSHLGCAITQLSHDAEDILLKQVKAIIDNLKAQSIKVMERKAADNKYLHKDFHLALNLLLTYIFDNFGKDAMTNYLRNFSQAYYRPLNQGIKSGDKEILVNHFKNIYEKEEWPVEITSHNNTIVIIQQACPGISHILKKGMKPCPYYREVYNTVNQTICMNTPFEYIMEYFNDETGACKQKFVKREQKL
jgi:hypothetical protein